ncbi:choice-of-anchor L domain-containing protein [Herpetosiphon giganteus]|uniref:choice-of-anchor L domain-containing protein n=1 Tax=Herpetosiphon giganteus TaxID=2029754 RepID=UPI00195C282A|nr:choice-of-anchor L domain-containing protein [Herpetosiphon giganteus]MBM7841571.1 hypothetical protein [Herpetosiphon giganteus]
MRIVRRSLSVLVGCSLILGLTPTFAQQPANQNQPTAINVVNPATPTEVALAMGIDPADLVSASFLGSDPVAFGVSNAQLGEYFPNHGNAFSIMSTGRAIDATLPDTPNVELGYHQNELVSNDQGFDLAQLRLQLQVPADKNCASFDFIFYSEEYPEFTRSDHNDAFTAELGGTNLSTSFYTVDPNPDDPDDDFEAATVVAPLNYVYDTNNQLIMVNSENIFSPNTGTTYNGASSIFRAETVVAPGSTVTIFLSVQDLFDSVGDTAVFLDNFFWSSNTACGGPTDIDTDGDGLLDSWEINGVNGVDLPAMGADPYHKDIFVEADYMLTTNGNVPHSHKPDQMSMDWVVTAFALAPVSNPDGIQGINLHIDSGPDSKMKADGTLWGSLSRATSVSHQYELGFMYPDIYGYTQYDWTQFNLLMDSLFDEERHSIFHYTIFAHDIDVNYLPSGISAGSEAGDPEGDHFIISIGDLINHPDHKMIEAGTFMHELGHNLGLDHGGQDNIQNKPNYLSVMNYYFQFSGLITRQGSRRLDYSRFHGIPDINENNLSEMSTISSDPAINKYRTYKVCFDINTNQPVDTPDNILNQPGWLDWNCNDLMDNFPYPQSINGDPNLETLKSFNDWDNLIYNGGAIGAPGSDRGEIVTSRVDEVPAEELIHDDLPYMLSISGDSYKNVLPNTATVSHTFTITNAGQLADSYTISATSSLGWNVSYTPQTISLAPGQSTQITVFEDIVSNGLVSKTDNLTIIVRSTHDSYTAAEAHGYTKTMVTPKVAFFPDSYSTEEKNVTVLVKVVLDKPVTSMVSVNFNTTNGTATGLLPCTSPRCVGTDGDFVHTSGVITFQPGQVEQFIPIQIQGDLINDPNEVFYINLSSPQSAVLGKFATASIQIQ